MQETEAPKNKMMEDEVITKKDEGSPEKKEASKIKIWHLILALIVLLIGLILYFTPIISLAHLFLDSQMQQAISFFAYSYKVIFIIFRGGKKEEISKNTLYGDLFENALEIHEKIANVNWLYWTMLFMPSYFLYAYVQESFLNLRRNVHYLKEDSKLKNNFINWQESMHVAMHQRIAELRVELKTLSSVLNAYRQKARERNKSVSADDVVLPAGNEGGTELVQDASRLSVARKNKSDSVIEERRVAGQPMKGLSPTWIDAKKRLKERSKEVPKSRIESARRTKEEEEGKQSSSSELPVVLPVEQRISIARSKFTARKSRAECKSFIPIKGPVRNSSKRTPEDEKILAHRNVISELKARNKKEEVSVSAVDLLQARDNSTRLNPKKRSLSEAAAKEMAKGGSAGTRRNTDPGEALRAVSFSNDEDIVAKFGLECIGRVKSYTEIFKKKVHVPNSGKEPEITIEGKRRWCF